MVIETGGDKLYADQPFGIMDLKSARFQHTCGKITLSSGKEVAMVAGGSGVYNGQMADLKSVEILYLGNLGAGWKYARDLPSTTIPGSRILTDFNREVTYFLTGSQAAELMCPDAHDATKCHFELLPGIKAKGISRDSGVIMAVPESLVETMCSDF